MGELLYQAAGKSGGRAGQIRRKARPRADESMVSVRATSNTPAGQGPRRLGEIEVGGGEVEVGYDEKQERLHLAFLQERRTQRARGVVTSSATERRAYGGKCLSNDEAFRHGVADLHAEQPEEQQKLLKNLRRTDGANGCPAVARVLPFTCTQGEGERIDALRAQAHRTDERAGLLSAVTRTEQERNQKGQCRRTFEAELRETVEPLWRERRTEGDLLLLLRKKQGEEAREEPEAAPERTSPEEAGKEPDAAKRQKH